MRRRPVKAPTGYGGGICTPVPRPFRRIEIAGKQARFISSTATPSEPVTGSGPPCPPRPALPSVGPACARPSSDSPAETRYGPSRVCKFFGALGCKTSQTERSSLSEQSATTRLQSVPDGQNFTRRDGVSPAAHICWHHPSSESPHVEIIESSSLAALVKR